MNDWPVVMPERYGNVPQDLTISEEELIKTKFWRSWMEIITVSNSLLSDFNIRCEITEIGPQVQVLKNMSWTYDASQQVLSLNDGNIRIYLQREVDWEATPRIAICCRCRLLQRFKRQLENKLDEE